MKVAAKKPHRMRKRTESLPWHFSWLRGPIPEKIIILRRLLSRQCQGPCHFSLLWPSHALHTEEMLTAGSGAETEQGWGGSMKCSEGWCPHSLGNKPSPADVRTNWKLKKLQGTIQEPFHGCLLCTGPLSPLAHLILQGAKGLDYFPPFDWWGNRLGDTKWLTQVFPAWWCDMQGFLNLGQDDRKEKLSLS